MDPQIAIAPEGWRVVGRSGPDVPHERRMLLQHRDSGTIFTCRAPAAEPWAKGEYWILEALPFSRERAEEAWAARGMQNTVHLSPAESAYVRQVWDTMPGNTCWMDAFFRILNGKVQP